MTTRISSAALLALGAALGLAACGSKGSTGPNFSSTITDSAAAAVGLNVANGFANGMFDVFDFHGPSVYFVKQADPQMVALLNRAWMAVGGRSPRYAIRGQGVAPVLQPVIATECNGGNWVHSSGDSSDVDGDGIPANYTLTFACDTIEDGVTYHYTGTEHLQDDPGLYGFTFSVNVILDSHDTQGHVAHYDLVGTETAAFTASLAQDHLNFTDHNTVTAAGVTTGGADHQQWDATFTPTSAALVVGSPLPDGHAAFTGGFYVTDVADSTQNLNFTVQTTVPLSFKSACSASYSQYDGGVITGYLNGRSDVGFTATYTSCDTDPTMVGTGNSI
ncbi:MAG: hypothetical protein ACREL4_09730 [Gemmatimonadales bacterium]